MNPFAMGKSAVGAMLPVRRAPPLRAILPAMRRMTTPKARWYTG
jgi:hypothetical protein